MYERDALRREVERLKIVASESTVDEVEDHVQALEAEIATLRGDLLDYQEQVELIAKELGNAGVMITEGPYDGVMTLINECYDLRAEIATLRKALDEAQARAAKSEVWLKWITNGKEGPSPSMFLDAYRK
jgi:chromosome segregation ATPase